MDAGPSGNSANFSLIGISHLVHKYIKRKKNVLGIDSAMLSSVVAASPSLLLTKNTSASVNSSICHIVSGRLPPQSPY